MAVHSSDLHRLIGSMSGPEKAYFKRYGYRAGNRRDAYLDLFIALEKQEEYSETLLRRKFVDKGIFRSLSAAKHHLYQQVLRALTDFHAAKSPEDQVLRLLQEVQLLRQRGLEDQCEKRIQQTRKVIGENDLGLLSPLLFEAELALIPYTEDSYPARFALLDREQQALEELLNGNAYRRLYAEMTHMVTRWGVIVRDPRHVREVEALLAHPLLVDEQQARSFSARYMFYSINKILNQVICRYEVALGYSLKAVEWFEDHPQLLERHRRAFFMAQFNLLNDLVGAGRLDEFDVWHQRIGDHIQALPDGDFKRESEANLTCRLVYTLILRRRYDKAWKEAEKLVAGLPHFHFQPHLSIQHRYLIACAAFYTGRLEKALDWISKLLTDKNLDSFRDYLVFSHILNLILHVELGNREHWPYARDRAYRLLSKKESLFQLEKIFLQFLRSYERLPDDQGIQRKALAALRKKLLPLKDDPYERNAFDYFDFIGWLDARVNGQPMMAYAAATAGKDATFPASGENRTTTRGKSPVRKKR